MIKIPKSIQRYLDDEKNVPLISANGTLWYYITNREKELLQKFVVELDSIPESIWRKWPEETILQYSHWGNLANNIVRNCIIKEI